MVLCHGSPGTLIQTWPEIKGSPKKRRGFPGGSNSKESTSVQGAQVQSLGQEDPLEKEMAAHSTILAWRIPWTEETGGL